MLPQPDKIIYGKLLGMAHERSEVGFECSVSRPVFRGGRGPNRASHLSAIPATFLRRGSCQKLTFYRDQFLPGPSRRALKRVTERPYYGTRNAATGLGI
jgi:hypothetical protein